MSKLVSSLALGLLVLPLMNCGSSQHAPEEKYVLIATNIKLPYWQQAAAGLAKAAAQLRIRAEMIGPDTYDLRAQHEQFQDVLKQKPTGILVSAGDPNLIKGDIDAAIAQGIPVISIDSDTPASSRLAFIGTDNYKAGQMAAQVAVKELKSKGNVVIYSMPEQTNLIERLHGYKDVFASYPQIKISEVVDMKGDPRVVFDKTVELVEKKANVDGFICVEAIACPEVAEVLDRKHVTGKVVVAMDTDQRVLEGIQKGQISASVGQKPFTMAFVGLKMLDDLHHNPLPSLTQFWSQDSFAPIPTFIDTGATLIDKSNVDKFIQARNTATGK